MEKRIIGEKYHSVYDSGIDRYIGQNDTLCLINRIYVQKFGGSFCLYCPLQVVLGIGSTHRIFYLPPNSAPAVPSLGFSISELIIPNSSPLPIGNTFLYQAHLSKNQPLLPPSPSTSTSNPENYETVLKHSKERTESQTPSSQPSLPPT
jgi:hypothetical protein